jgi:iron(III) transport system ATP-binding protein
MDSLRVTALAKRFGLTPVLREVSFTVAPGELVAILGASGSGKTTLLRLIAGFERPDAGEISLGGDVLVGPKVFRRPEQRGIGYVAQEGALFPHLCVADNITFGLARTERRARYRVAELLAMVDLPPAYADRAPRALSGGEQQRVALARALAPSPRLLLLDEPFSALDASLRAETRRAVAAAIRASGATAILVTHDQEEALSMGARAGVLQQGHLAQMSTPQALYREPANPVLANFIGEAVLLPGIVQGGLAHCALGALPLGRPQAPGEVQVMIRPEQIKIRLGPEGIPATVAAVTFYGHDAVIGLALEDAGRVHARVFSHHLPPIGTQVWLSVAGPVAVYPKH